MIFVYYYSSATSMTHRVAPVAIDANVDDADGVAVVVVVSADGEPFCKPKKPSKPSTLNSCYWKSSTVISKRIPFS
jgi:hypothetical protein